MHEYLLLLSKFKKEFLFDSHNYIYTQIKQNLIINYNYG